MDLVGREVAQIAELARLKASLEPDYLRAFVDSMLKEAYLRVKLLESLDAPDIELEGASMPLEAAVERLEEVVRLCERQLEDVRRLREKAETPLQLEVIAAVEKSLERTHISVRMLINAVTELGKGAKAAGGPPPS